MQALQTNDIKIETKKIHDVLLTIGIPSHLLGYTYIITALEYVSLNPMYLNLMTKQLYPSIAKTHATTPSSVERAIRHAISVGWSCGNIDYIYEIFKNSVRADKGVPTNSLFLARLFHYFNTAESVY